MKLALPLLALLLGAAPIPAAAGEAPGVRPLIANGLASAAWPEVGVLLTSSGTCTVTAIGCRAALTAAHCVCSASGSGAPCGTGESLVDPADAVVLLPQAGVLGVEAISISPGYEFGIAGDVAVLSLSRPLRGVRPRAINEALRPAVDTSATIVGYGATGEGTVDAGIKRTGAVTTASCSALGVPAASHVCWVFAAPLGPAGTDSNTCSGDSGGPLLADLGAGLTLVGVHSGGSLAGCDLLPTVGFDTDVFVERGWIRSVAGVDLDEQRCGDGPQAGDPEVTTLAFAGTAASQSFHDFTIPAGVKRLRVALNGELDPASDLDLYARLGARPTTSAFDCDSVFAGSFEYCEIADPAPGSGHVLVRRNGSTSAYQVTVTLLPEDPSPTALAPGGILVAAFRSFELVQVDPAGGQRAVVSSDLRGAGPALAGPEGVAPDVDGSVMVANAFERNLLRVDPATGARTLVSGCADAACSSTRGAGPAFLSPRFVARWPDGAWLVADRSDPGIYALVIVNPTTGDRGVLSGCVDAQCSAVIGSGPAIGRLFGLAVEPGGTVAVADGRAVYRIDLVSGDRTVLSGCADAACSSVVGGGPAFGEPVDLLAEPDGMLLVSYRGEGGPFGAIRRVDPATGDRTLLSGCEDAACTSARGAGPAFVDLFGLAREASGELLATDASLDAILRVDPETGDRTLVSGCADASCSAAAGGGPGLGEPVDLLVVPVPEPGAGSGAALGLLLAGAARRRTV